ncbi:unnamed protein product, partial [Cyprideis torosa]
MPPRGGNAELSDADLKSAVVYMLQESGQTVADNDSAQSQKSQQLATTTATSTTETTITSPGKGEEIYLAACVSCHGTGLMEAPKLEDKANWEARFAQGLDGVVENAKNGKGNMPPRGGNAELSDVDLKSVVVYMLQQSGQTVAQ